MNTKLSTKRITADVTWWAAVIGLLLLSQLRAENLLYILQETGLGTLFDPAILEKPPLAISNIVTPIRGVTLLFSLIALFYPILRDFRGLKEINDPQIKAKNTWVALFAFIILCVLFTPGGINGLAEEYSNTSIALFEKVGTVNYNHRILMPALANILFMRGDFFFRIFSFICTVVLVFILRLWFKSNNVDIPLWQLISLGTLSFVYFQIRNPGYPDVLVNIFILAAFIPGVTPRAKLSLYVLSLASHEASLIIWFALALALFNPKEWGSFLIVSGIYILLLVALNDGISGLVATRNVGEKSNLAWVLENPGRDALGVLFSLKALWGIVISALAYLLSQKRAWEIIQIIAILAAGILLTFMGVDTSRLAGWAFMAVLISWKILSQAEGGWKKTINIVLMANILIPSVDVYLFGTPSIPPGIYQYVYGVIFQSIIR